MSLNIDIVVKASNKFVAANKRLCKILDKTKIGMIRFAQAADPKGTRHERNKKRYERRYKRGGVK